MRRRRRKLVNFVTYIQTDKQTDTVQFENREHPQLVLRAAAPLRHEGLGSISTKILTSPHYSLRNDWIVNIEYYDVDMIHQLCSHFPGVYCILNIAGTSTL